MDGANGESSAEKVCAILSEIKDKYINSYYEEHKKKRLNINDAKRRGKLQESLALSNLQKLRTIEILSSAKLSNIEQALSELKVCYELTPEELKFSSVCPHCHYSLGDKVKNTAGQLDKIEELIDNLVIEWTNTLRNTISDPLVLSQKEYLSAQQIEVIDEFIESKVLPHTVDDFFVKSINVLLKGFETVVIKTEDFIQKLDVLGPCDIDTFKNKIADIVEAYIKGKDTSKLRIVVKRKESEE